MKEILLTFISEDLAARHNSYKLAWRWPSHTLPIVFWALTPQYIEHSASCNLFIQCVILSATAWGQGSMRAHDKNIAYLTQLLYYRIV